MQIEQISTVLSNLAGANVYALEAQTNFYDIFITELLSVWIDFNDNFIFEASEQLISGERFQTSSSLSDFDLTIPLGSATGSHIMRAKAISSATGNGDINDPCGDYGYGETQDYTVVIRGNPLSTDENELQNSDLKVYSEDNKNFEISLTSQTEGKVFVIIYNSIGQLLKYKPLKRTGNKFSLSLNMESASAGLYFIRMRAVEEQAYKTTKIVVK